MYAQIFFVTSVRGMVLPPQTLANASLSFFGAKMPFPDFFMAAASLLPLAFFAVLPKVRFKILRVFKVAFVIVVRVFFVVAFAALVVLALEVVALEVIAIEG